MVVTRPLSLAALGGGQAKGGRVHPGAELSLVVHGVVVADGFAFGLGDGDETRHASGGHHGDPVGGNRAVVAAYHVLTLSLYEIEQQKHMNINT